MTSSPPGIETDGSTTGTSSGPLLSAAGHPFNCFDLQRPFIGMSARDVYALLCKRSGCKVVSAVAAMLPDKAGQWEVTDLDLSRTYVGHRGACVIVELCKLFDRLKSLSLRDNYITNKTVFYVAKMAAFHPTLSAIDLSENAVSWTAGMCLLELATVNPRIQQLSLSGTEIKPKVAETIATQIRRNAMAGARPIRRGHCSTNHPLTIRQRALKRFFRDLVAKEAAAQGSLAGAAAAAVAAGGGYVSRDALADGFREMLRLAGRESEISKKSPAFFDAFCRRAPGLQVDWETFMLLVMLEEVAFDQRAVDDLRAIFQRFDTDGGGYVMFVDLPDMMAAHSHGIYPSAVEVTMKKEYYAADDAMTMTWDEFLLLMYDHGPVVGEMSTFHTHTPLKKARGKD